MKIQQKIPVLFRVPLALLIYMLIAFGPFIGLVVFRPFNASPWILIGIGVVWILIYYRFLLRRLDTFWNLRSGQNRTDSPSYPDNYREFTTLKGWLGWLFLGKDCESTTPNKAMDENGEHAVRFGSDNEN